MGPQRTEGNRTSAAEGWELWQEPAEGRGGQGQATGIQDQMGREGANSFQALSTSNSFDTLPAPSSYRGRDAISLKAVPSEYCGWRITCYVYSFNQLWSTS